MSQKTPSKTVAKGTRHASCDKNMTNNELKQNITPRLNNPNKYVAIDKLKALSGAQ